MQIPKDGMSNADILNHLQDIQQNDIDYKGGKAFGMVFNPDPEGYKIAKEAYSMFLSTNGLDFSQFPSLLHLEKDIVGFMNDHLNGGPDGAGSFTSGGTESIILAIKTARDHARKHKPQITQPEILLPVTAHAAHWKGCHYLGVQPVTVPVREDDFRIDPEDMAAAITENTIAIVGSAPSYTYGVIDPIYDLGQLALKHGLWLHVDGCMGGFMLPFYRLCGMDIPPFDFAVPGVSSISTDLHKYAYCPKGASVVMYRNKELRSHQWFVGGQWLGYPMVNSTIQSSKSGGSLAAAWSVMNHFGQEGYRRLAQKHIDATDQLLKGMKEIEGVNIPVDPDFCILGFDTPGKSIFQVADLMKERGWFVQPILGHNPFKACLHITISNLNFDRADEFLAALKESVQLANSVELDPMMSQMLEGLKQMPVEAISPDFLKMAIQGFGLTEGELPSGGMAEANEALNQLTSDFRDLILKHFVNEVF